MEENVHCVFEMTLIGRHSEEGTTEESTALSQIPSINLLQTSTNLQQISPRDKIVLNGRECSLRVRNDVNWSSFRMRHD